jgi:hypothetical protein
VKCLLSPTRIGLFIVRRAGRSGSLDEAARCRSEKCFYSMSAFGVRHERSL